MSRSSSCLEVAIDVGLDLLRAVDVDMNNFSLSDPLQTMHYIVNGLLRVASKVPLKKVPRYSPLAAFQMLMPQELVLFNKNTTFVP